MKLAKGFNLQTIGKRKTSVARVYLKEGSGDIVVNGLPYQDYFKRDTLKMVIRQPLEAVSLEKKFDFVIFVKGGGLTGQAGACKHGISRALNDYDPELRATLKPLGFLTRDSREVERKKYGRHKARKSVQFSKR